MRSILYKLFILFCVLPTTLLAQFNDCTGARIICDGENITLNPQGPGFDDYSDPSNNPGCLIDRENNTAWYYFEIEETAPFGLVLGFTINPNGGLGEDYDWALYGPDVFCHSLGSPIRCSSSSDQCGFCPKTGMGMGTTDFSEGPGSGDGFVATLTVEPGQGFFLVIDNWEGTQKGFVLTWTGTAAEFLNCDADIPCDLIADAGTPIITCGGEVSQIELDGTSQNNHGNEIYTWSGADGTTMFLNNANIPNPTLTIPPDYIGNIIYTLTVTEDSCISTDQMTVIVSIPDVEIEPAGPFCESGMEETLTATPAGGVWGGAAIGNTFDPKVHGAGFHTVTYSYTDNKGCTSTDQIEIEVGNASGLALTIGNDLDLSLGDEFTITAITNFPFNQIDTIIWFPADGIECLDSSCAVVNLIALNDMSLTATVVDLQGCSATDELNINVNKNRKIFVPTAFTPNNDGINDILYISADKQQIAVIKKFIIYDRWGNHVHEAKNFQPGDISKGWAGISRNKKINPGVFVYAIEVEFIDGEVMVYSGDITLIK